MSALNALFMILRNNGKLDRRYGARFKQEKEYHFARLFPVIEPLDLDGERGLCIGFGCGKKLTLAESRYGNKCISCSGKNKNDIIGFLQPM